MSARFAHVNLVARDWRRLARFYVQVFGCRPAGPERDLHGEWLERATGVRSACLSGVHLRLPGGGEAGPTLEIFEYAGTCEAVEDAAPAAAGRPRNSPRVHAADELGFGHLAFEVEDVEKRSLAVIAAGGSAVGELTTRKIPEVGTITFRYLADPEGNLIEVQRWESSPRAPGREDRPHALTGGREGAGARERDSGPEDVEPRRQR